MILRHNMIDVRSDKRVIITHQVRPDSDKKRLIWEAVAFNVRRTNRMKNAQYKFGR